MTRTIYIVFNREYRDRDDPERAFPNEDAARDWCLAKWKELAEVDTDNVDVTPFSIVPCEMEV